MKTTIALVLLSFWTTLALSEYPRLKYRGPHPPPKHPPYPHYAKKWQRPPRHPVRSRPIPVHMPPQHKIPIGMAPSINRPIAVPVRTFWKNTQTTFRTPVAAESVVVPKKVFLSSPAIVPQEYDFGVRSNNIPTPYKTIKQIGEKGPIHTIPAPNLSPADKPYEVEAAKRQPYAVEEAKRQPETTYVQIQKAQQYQVTEVPPENVQKQTIYKNYYDQTQFLSGTEPQSSPNTQFLGGTEPQLSPNPQFLGGTEPQLTPNELFQLIHQYQQPQLVLQQQEYLQVPNLGQQLDPTQIASDKVGTQPEYQSFNYEEQNQLKKKVTAGYNLEARNNPTESLSQSQYVQSYFDTRDGTANNVEPDAKPSQEKNISSSSPPRGYYVSLPNKEAADTLASLQAAGKINSNLMQLANKGEGNLPISIYVPDSGEEKGKVEEEFASDEDENYDDYSQEDLIPEEGGHQRDDSFGHRLQAKQN